jgi:hypothetical protein
LALGTLMAMIRPPARHESGDLERPPLSRSVLMIAVGAVAAVWGLATLLSG